MNNKFYTLHPMKVRGALKKAGFSLGSWYQNGRIAMMNFSGGTLEVKEYDKGMDKGFCVEVSARKDKNDKELNKVNKFLNSKGFFTKVKTHNLSSKKTLVVDSKKVK